MSKHKKEQAQPQLTPPRPTTGPVLFLVHVQLQYHATLSALLEERDPEMYDTVQLQFHAILSALL